LGRHHKCRTLVEFADALPNFRRLAFDFGLQDVVPHPAGAMEKNQQGQLSVGIRNRQIDQTFRIQELNFGLELRSDCAHDRDFVLRHCGCGKDKRGCQQ